MRVDAHQHYWRIGRNGHVWPTPDLVPIHRDFLPRDLDGERDALGIAATVAVQSQPDDLDTAWLLDLAARTPSIAAVVGWVDLRAADAPAQIARLARNPKLRGLRPMLQNLPAEWIEQPAAAPALLAMVEHDLVFDALIRPHHLPAIGRIAATYPTLRIVVDHGGKPAIAQRSHEPWARDLAALGRLPNVACKLSGLVTEAEPGWAVDDLRPYAEHVLDVFGSSRTLWGSDWPVLLLAGSYAEWARASDDLLSSLDADDRACVLGDTARNVYRIS
ncbi:L-fuconolactonase [Sphingomonas insulae]|uniref:Amidohydrolase family protein n=1 Tax=Sphingomonas insulae TaxID=424800 RepID=A0ABP3T2D2_9SPHN|nr:amidohydrolase family protein [Sphingomonas insulae]NIJ31105.1 L-fuconolactonase [Sphingomonas insulae]